MELIKRYVFAVGKRVPRKQHEDIEKELESAIFDMLEDKFGKKSDYSESEIEEVLKVFGPPWEVAMGYQKNPGHLIGPELINTYYLVIKIVSGAVTLGLLVSFIVGLFQPELTIGKFFLEILGLIPSVLTGVITAIGFVTVIFYLIERNAPGYRLKDTMASVDWKPKDLPRVPNKKEKITIGESVVGIVFTIIAIIIFNFFAEKLGIYYTETFGEPWKFVQIFSQEAIITYLPFWNAVWIISLIFQIFCLIQREWNVKTRLFDIFTNLLSIGILTMMIKGPELVDMNLLLSNTSSDVANSLTPLAELLNYSLDFVLIFALVGTIIGLIVKVIKLFISIALSPSKN
ncbi:MAG: hypothetical protein JXQ23_02375 [Clostridia bacterium]|nr:hypothetical protein [Clostridia bacterium]